MHAAATMMELSEEKSSGRTHTGPPAFHRPRIQACHNKERYQIGPRKLSIFYLHFSNQINLISISQINYCFLICVTSEV